MTKNEKLADAKKSLAYTISLQRAIESVCRGKVIPEQVAIECPHHAGLLHALQDQVAVGARDTARLTIAIKLLIDSATSCPLDSYMDPFSELEIEPDCNNCDEKQWILCWIAAIDTAMEADDEN